MLAGMGEISIKLLTKIGMCATMEVEGLEKCSRALVCSGRGSFKKEG